jgi:hypothetical protein
MESNSKAVQMPTAPEVRSYYVDGPIAGQHLLRYRAQWFVGGEIRFGAECRTSADALAKVAA